MPSPEKHNMRILVLNHGSSSIKYQLFEMPECRALAAGLLDRIGEAGSEIADHTQGLDIISKTIGETGSDGLFGIGHRVVHGGEAFREPTLIDDQVLEIIRHQIPLAPLHNPANVMGIEAALASFPGVPQVAVFDTAFHQTIPPHAYHYALPYELYEKHHIRRYGFHGTSHLYVSKQAAKHLGKPLESVNLIVMHLGNGASVTAVGGGKSVDTSMGLTPLEGLVMGTRCGDIDPAVVFHLAKTTGMSIDELDRLLNKESGLKGICGAADMREVLQRAEAGDERAQLALDIYSYRLKKYIGCYYAVLGSVDALVFTGGIGENASTIRACACDRLGDLGIELDSQKNESPSNGIRAIHREGCPVAVLVIPTNEELEIAEQSLRLIQRVGRAPQ